MPSNLRLWLQIQMEKPENPNEHIIVPHILGDSARSELSVKWNILWIKIHLHINYGKCYAQLIDIASFDHTKETAESSESHSRCLSCRESDDTKQTEIESHLCAIYII